MSTKIIDLRLKLADVEGLSGCWLGSLELRLQDAIAELDDCLGADVANMRDGLLELLDEVTQLQHLLEPFT